MIRKTISIAVSLLIVASCATNKNFQSSESFAPAQFQISDVYVNTANEVENASRLRKLTLVAGKNTARVYNQDMNAATASYPLEIEIQKINYRKPSATATSADRTYISFTATLREAASGIVYRELPVTYYHVTTGALDSDAAKQMAEKNMIRLALKNAFARLYGMPEVPQTVQTYFNSHDIFSKGEVKPKPAPAVIAASPRTQTQTQTTTSAPEVIVAPNEPIIETTTNADGVEVIKCVVC